VTLTFKAGIFYLEDASLDATAQIFRMRNDGDRAWSRNNPDDFCTDSLRAAVRFRPYADKATEKIFKRMLSRRYPAPSLPPLAFLDPHQKSGVEHVLSRKASYLAHAPGAGKTATALTAALLCKGRGQILFIVPPHLTVNWVREVNKFAGLVTREWVSLAVVHEAKHALRVDWSADILIVADSMISRAWVLKELILRDFKFVGVDEAHRYKDAATTRARMLFGGEVRGIESPGLVQDARHGVLLSGTPMPNRAMELWAPTYAMTPETINFMAMNDFGLRYGRPTYNSYGKLSFPGTSNEKELRGLLRKEFMHVISSDHLCLPEKRRALVYMTGDPRSPEMKTWERKNAGNVKLADLSESSSQGDLARWRREIGLGKIKWVSQFVADIIENGNESIILFAWHREVVEGLAKALKKFKPGVVMGGVKTKDRTRIFDSFQKGKRKLIIGNIGAMGEGENLQRADRVIFGEYSWTDDTNKQCEARAHRRGRKKMVHSQYIVAGNTLDEVILSTVFRKEKDVKGVIG